VVEHISNDIAVMYVGKIVEKAETEELLYHPLHPYTEALVSAIPVINSDKSKKRIYLEGDVPNPVNAPSGCVFHPRCRYATPECSQNVPELKEVGGNHLVACHNYDKISFPARSWSVLRGRKTAFVFIMPGVRLNYFFFCSFYLLTGISLPIFF